MWIMFAGFVIFLTGMFTGLHQYFVHLVGVEKLADQHRAYWKGREVILQEDGKPLMYVGDK